MLLVVMPLLALADPPLAPEMHTRFDLLSEIRDAVVAGRLEAAQDSARALLALDPATPLPTGSEGHVVAIQSEVKRVVGARDLASAAQATAKTARACAACHDANAGGPSLDRIGDVPPPDAALGAGPPPHAQATEWMWLGLLANDDPAWIRGAGALVGPAAGPPEPGIAALPARALTVEQPTQRAEILGTFLATCAACHRERPLPEKP